MKYLVLVFALVAGSLRASTLVQTFDSGSNSDSDVVHGLAHMAAGTWAAVPTQILWTVTQPEGSWERSWWFTGITGFATGALVTDLYERETDKSNVVRFQHDFDGGLGGLFPAGFSWSHTW